MKTVTGYIADMKYIYMSLIDKFPSSIASIDFLKFEMSLKMTLKVVTSDMLQKVEAAC